MRDSVELMCPYCGEQQELDLDPGTSGSFVQDCDVCCRPWQIFVAWDGDEPLVSVERAQ